MNSTAAANSGKRRSAPVEPLNRERIVSAALDEIAEGGLAAFSIRKLGGRLGVEAMSIYHHFPSKQHLLDALIDHALASIERPPDDLPPIERLRHAMYGYRSMAHRFPTLYPLLAVHRLNTETGVRYIESTLVLVEAVLPDAELAARHFRTLGYFLAGACLDETSGYAHGPSAAEPVTDTFVAQECPRLLAAGRYFKQDQWDATFALGVETMLDAVVHDARRLARERGQGKAKGIARAT